MKNRVFNNRVKRKNTFETFFAYTMILLAALKFINFKTYKFTTDY